MSVKRRRIPSRVTSWLKKTNPSLRSVSAVRVKRLKSGGLTISPVRSNGPGVMSAARVKQIKRRLDQAYRADERRGKPDNWGVVYDTPRFNALIDKLKASGEWGPYKEARGIS